MWNDIRDEKTLEEFMESMDFFHDSCMKEMKYVSGAYVEEDLGMYPVNDRRILNVIIQRQYEENSMIEMEFSGMKYLQLKPVVEEWTGEINDATMILKEDRVYWCDCWGGYRGDNKRIYGNCNLCRKSQMAVCRRTYGK